VFVCYDDLDDDVDNDDDIWW